MVDFKELIYRGVESDVLDYKAPVDWTLLTRQQKAKFVRHALAFANTRGGSIVIGVREDVNGHPSLYEGLNDQQCRSFDPSLVGSYINSHVDPAIDLTVERPLVDGKRYAILMIKPFSDIPHVAVHSIDEELRSGVFYIRSASASSRPAARAGEMHDLVRRALRNQRDMLGELLREILGDQPQQPVVPTAAAPEILPMEYDESVSYFRQRLNANLPADTPMLDIAVMPLEAQALKLPELRKAVLKAIEGLPQRQKLLNSADMLESYATNVSLRGISKQRDRFWQIFQNGLLHLRTVMPMQLDKELLETQLRQLLKILNGVYGNGCFSCNRLFLQLSVENADRISFATPGNSASGSEKSIRVTLESDIDRLKNSPEFLLNELSEKLRKLLTGING